MHKQCRIRLIKQWNLKPKFSSLWSSKIEGIFLPECLDAAFQRCSKKLVDATAIFLGRSRSKKFQNLRYWEMDDVKLVVPWHAAALVQSAQQFLSDRPAATNPKLSHPRYPRSAVDR